MHLAGGRSCDTYRRCGLELVGARVLCNRRMFGTVVLYGICSRSVGFRSFNSCSILVSSSSCSMVGAGFIGSVRFLLARNVVWSIDWFLGERVFGLHFTDLLFVGSERDGLVVR